MPSNGQATDLQHAIFEPENRDAAESALASRSLFLS